MSKALSPAVAGWVFITLILTLRIASSTAGISYFILAMYALFGRSQAIQALALSWLMTMLSPGIVEESASGTVGRYMVLATASISIFLRSGVILRAMRISWPVLGTILIGTFLVAHSLFFSPVKDVSVLKAISWTVAAATLLAGWWGLSISDRRAVERRIFGGLIVLLIVSLPLLALPVGYLRNGSGFQGVLNHPQAFGPTMGLLGAWAGSRMLADKNPAWSLVALFGTCLVLVVLSQARTAGISLLLGIIFAAIIGQGLTGRSISAFLPGVRSRRVHFVAGLSVVAVLLGSATLSNRMSQYMAKGSGSSNLAEAYEASRGFLIDRMLVNIRENPWTGIGFGIASEPDKMVVDRDPLLGLPTGAAIEKGVLPIAVLEELGVFGLIAVMLWLWMLVRRASRGGGMPALAVLTTVLLLNMGESVLFSPGGFGLLPLILICWSATERPEIDAQRARA